MDDPVLKGVAASSGTAEGIVKIVERHGNGPLPDFPEGAILVTQMTEPAMVVLMNKAAGIITDIGGLTSHAAIVSRELGVPCVTGTKTATSTLKDGMRVRIDGTAGLIYEL